MNLGLVGTAITAKLNAAFAPLMLEVIDESHHHHGHAGAHPQGESHFRVRLVSAAFTGKSRVAQQRMVNAVLADELKTRIHALALETKAPE
jgi:BolA protein